MGLLQKWLYGIDVEAEQERSDELDARLADLNRAAYDAGKYTPQSYYEREQNREAGRLNAEKEVNQAFVEGLKEGAASIPTGINSALSTATRGIFSAIPLSVWLVAGLALFVWAGGLGMLKGRLAKL